jgi:hypothetical protein
MSARKRRTSPPDKRAQVMQDLARRLGSPERAEEFLQREDKKRKELEGDSVCTTETEKLQERFEAAYLSKPQLVDTFLARFRFPTPFNQEKVQKFVDKRTPKISDLFRRYIEYANRFGVFFRRKENQSTFECRILPPEFGWKFRANQSGGHLVPRVAVEEDEVATDYFEDVTLHITDAFEKLVRLRKAKFVQIDDVSGTSVLNEIENFAYFDSGVTFIEHNAERRYLFCLIGEKFNKRLWDEAGRGVTDFQKGFGRGKAGRPRELGVERKVREKAKTGERKKQIAGDEVLGISLASAQSRVSRILRADRERAGRIEKLKREFDAEK